MNTSNPPSAHQNDRFPLPEFLGVSPDEGPERLPKPPWDTICEVVGRIADHCPGHEPTPSHSQLRRFFQRFLTLDQSSFAEGITAFFDTEHKWPRLPSPCWEDLLFYLDPDPDRVPKKKDSPDAARSIIATPSHSAREPVQITEAYARALQQARAERLAKEIPKPKAGIEKQLQPPSKDFLLLLNYISDRAPSPKKTKELFLWVHAHCFNKHSKWGIKVYIYGQVYACKAIGLPTRKRENRPTEPGREFDPLWAWLKKEGFFNKRSNENPKAHRCAGWFVCTSLKQRDHFRIPRDHPRKTGR